MTDGEAIWHGRRTHANTLAITGFMPVNSRFQIVEAPYEPEIMRSTLVAKHANTRLIHRRSGHIASP